jgi:hypothetical protein
LTFGIALGRIVAVVLAVVSLRCCTFPPAPVRVVGGGYLIDGPGPLTPGEGNPMSAHVDGCPAVSSTAS